MLPFICYLMLTILTSVLPYFPSPQYIAAYIFVDVSILFCGHPDTDAKQKTCFFNKKQVVLNRVQNSCFFIVISNLHDEQEIYHTLECLYLCYICIYRLIQHKTGCKRKKKNVFKLKAFDITMSTYIS